MSLKNKDELVYGKALQELLMENKFDALEYFMEHKDIKNKKDVLLSQSIKNICSALTRENCVKAKKAIEYIFNRKDINVRPFLNLNEIIEALSTFLAYEGVNDNNRASTKSVVFSKWKEIVVLFKDNVSGFSDYSFEKKNFVPEEGFGYSQKVKKILKKEHEILSVTTKKVSISDLLLNEAFEHNTASLNSYFSFLISIGNNFSLDKNSVNNEDGSVFNYLNQLSIADLKPSEFVEQKKLLDLILLQMKQQGVSNFPLSFESMRTGVLEVSNVTKNKEKAKLSNPSELDGLSAQEKKNVILSTNNCVFYKKKNVTGLISIMFSKLSEMFYDDAYSINKSLNELKTTLELFKYLCARKDVKLSGKLSKDDLEFFSTASFTLKELLEAQQYDPSSAINQCVNNFKNFLKEMSISLGQTEISLKELKKVLPEEFFGLCEQERLSKKVGQVEQENGKEKSVQESEKSILSQDGENVSSGVKKAKLRL